MEIDLEDTDFMVLDIPFGLIPLNIDHVYPLSQNESPKIRDVDGIEFVENILTDFIEDYSQILIHQKIVEDYNMDLYNIHPESDKIKFAGSDKDQVIAIADYQFGKGAGKALFEGNLEISKSKKTGRIRHIFSKDELVANVRASDSFLILSKEGAKRLHRFMEFPKNRVIVDEESEPFILDGRSVFSKFVLDCDENIRADDEVLIVNEKDELLAYGKSYLNHNEIMNFNTGQAIKTRKGNVYDKEFILELEDG
jgi:7-cyano-7-deazaguanine tRNA-ribosyltransferase